MSSGEKARKVGRSPVMEELGRDAEGLTPVRRATSAKQAHLFFFRFIGKKTLIIKPDGTSY